MNIYANGINQFSFLKEAEEEKKMNDAKFSIICGYSQQAVNLKKIIGCCLFITGPAGLATLTRLLVLHMQYELPIKLKLIGERTYMYDVTCFSHYFHREKKMMFNNFAFLRLKMKLTPCKTV